MDTPCIEITIFLYLIIWRNTIEMVKDVSQNMEHISYSLFLELCDLRLIHTLGKMAGGKQPLKSDFSQKTL